MDNAQKQQEVQRKEARLRYLLAEPVQLVRTACKDLLGTQACRVSTNGEESCYIFPLRQPT